jgi:hypothetical protein
MVRFQVLTSASMKMTVFWDVAPCSLVKVFLRFIDACCLIIKAASTSETSVNFYQTTRRNTPENTHLHTHNMKFSITIRTTHLSIVLLRDTRIYRVSQKDIYTQG